MWWHGNNRPSGEGGGGGGGGGVGWGVGGRQGGSRLEREHGDKQGKAHNPPVYSVQAKPSQQ